MSANTINIIISLLSFILAAISVITVIITLRQNNKMLEESSRPYLSFYTDEINTGSPTYFFVVRNFGHSAAIIRSISSDICFSSFLVGAEQLSSDFLARINPINQLVDAVIAPGQSRIAAIDYDKVPDRVTISVMYSSTSGKTYTEKSTIDLKAGVGMVRPKSAVNDEKEIGKTLKNISYTLQEILQKRM